MAYTPGVARVSTAIARDPDTIWNLTIKRNTLAVVSDGSAVLGLGDIGPGGALPVMEGKAVLFKGFAGVDAFPICLDTNDVEEIILIVRAIAPVVGGIDLEDISAPRCFEIERRLREILDIPVFHALISPSLRVRARACAWALGARRASNPRRPQRRSSGSSPASEQAL